MRCQFCGWDNPQGKDTCEKCNKPLAASSGSETSSHLSESPSANHDRPTERKNDGAFNPKATVREVAVAGKEAQSDNESCPNCGYGLENGSCASCGYQIPSGHEAGVPISRIVVDGRKTVRPIRKGEKEGTFTLTPISEESGCPEGEPLQYEGNTVSLNRDNTDTKNQTITSAEQARVSLDNNEWSIEDKSEYKTTFVQASRKIALKKGDLILLGNQLYRFDC